MTTPAQAPPFGPDAIPAEERALAEDLLASADAAIPCEHCCHAHAGYGEATLWVLCRCPGCGSTNPVHAWCAGCLGHHGSAIVSCKACEQLAPGRRCIQRVTPIRPGGTARQDPAA